MSMAETPLPLPSTGAVCRWRTSAETLDVVEDEAPAVLTVGGAPFVLEIEDRDAEGRTERDDG